MKRVLDIVLASRDEFLDHASSALGAFEKTGRAQNETLAFSSPSVFFSELSPKRWEMLEELEGMESVGVRELARRLRRDVKNVHSDATALIGLGLVEKSEEGKLSCPYNEIHLDMTLTRPTSSRKVKTARAIA
jgi:predicted transcriptional regulator